MSLLTPNPRLTTSLLAERSSLETGETWTVELTACIEAGFRGSGVVYLQLRGGPSGFESLNLQDLDTACREGGGWVACKGDGPNLDRLWVSAEELVRVRRELGV